MHSLRATEIFHDSRRMLIAIESVIYNHSTSIPGYQLYGRIEPIAVIVCSSDEIYALDTLAEITDIDHFRRDIPELDAMIASFKDERQQPDG